ncbi:YrhB domain-containing protein [Pseudomonas sp. NPDC089406]|uniref:YrhB domain-containing protein n=1 Tax=Pseudomonas sp. NPDC089406 TaxID=3364463 RepID=UPI00384E63AB
MVTYVEALALAREYLEDSDIPLEIVYEGEFSEGWYFCYQSKEYLDTGESSAKLAGNAPFIIDRTTGVLHEFGTAYSLESYLEEYVRLKLEGSSE